MTNEGNFLFSMILDRERALRGRFFLDPGFERHKRHTHEHTSKANVRMHSAIIMCCIGCSIRLCWTTPSPSQGCTTSSRIICPSLQVSCLSRCPTVILDGIITDARTISTGGGQIRTREKIFRLFEHLLVD